MSKTDYEVTGIIVNTFERLKVDDIVILLDELPTEETEVEFYPLINAAKDVLERMLRAAVLLGKWTGEEKTKIRKTANMKLYGQIREGLDQINNDFITNLNLTEAEDMEMMITLTANMLKIQYYFWKWLVYLTVKYNVDRKPMITFAFE